MQAQPPEPGRVEAASGAASPLAPVASNGARTAALAGATVAALDAEAFRLRSQLATLRRELAEAQQSFDTLHAAQLLEANERLVVAALRAELIAESAVSNLDEMERSSHRDPLTDTPNRILMLDRMETALANARRQGSLAAVLFIDLDRFKAINDSLGHAVGDRVLQLVANRLQASVRDSDTVSRHGGDEFLILLAGVAHVNDAAHVAEKILLAIEAPSVIGEHRLMLTASVGIAVFPGDGEDAEALIGFADSAMYQAKKLGAGGFAFHRPGRSGHTVAGELPP